MNYGWLLLRVEGGNQQHYPRQQAGGNWYGSLLFPFQRFPGSRDALSGLSHTQFSPCYSLSYICGKAIILQDLRALHQGSDFCSTDAVVSARRITAGAMIHKPWTLCIPNAWVQKGRLQEQQASSQRSGREWDMLTQWPKPRPRAESIECPRVTRPGSLLDLFQGNTPFRALSKGMKSMLLCIQTFPLSVSRAGQAQWS